MKKQLIWVFEWRKSVHYWWSYILFSPECKELTSMLNPLLYRWSVPPVVIRCVHWTMQMWVLQTWIKAQGLAILMDVRKHYDALWTSNGKKKVPWNGAVSMHSRAGSWETWSICITLRNNRGAPTDMHANVLGILIICRFNSAGIISTLYDDWQLFLWHHVPSSGHACPITLNRFHVFNHTSDSMCLGHGLELLQYAGESGQVSHGGVQPPGFEPFSLF